MNVITVASRKGGAGKTTLCAHLAALARSQGYKCQVIDGDPQGSLALCNRLRADAALPFATAERGIDRALAMAQVAGIEWVFIDTSPTMWVVVQEAIRAATLVLIPARPGFLDLDAVRETVKTARERNKPYAVVLNACPVKRGVREAPAVAQSRAYLEREGVPVFAGQISHRASFSSHARGRRQRRRGRAGFARRRRDREALERGREERRRNQRALCRRGSDREPDARAGGVASSPPRRASLPPSRLSGHAYGARSRRARRCARTSRCRPRIPIPSRR